MNQSNNNAVPIVSSKEGAYTFFDTYMQYVGITESPALYHRWTALSIIGALIARKIYFPFGHSFIYPNQYVLLTGTPGARKGTAIKIGTNLLQEIDYPHLAPNRAAKEAFWVWMAKHGMQDMSMEDDQNMDSWVFNLQSEQDNITEAYIAQDEFLDFIGSNDKDFVTNLANLWDNLPKYDNPKTRDDDVYISNPTLSILSGIRPTGIAEGFKVLAVGGGFFSRIIFVYTNPTGVKITYPTKPCEQFKSYLTQHLLNIKELEGELILTNEVRDLIDQIYKKAPGMPDRRFQYYNERRLTHLIKLILILSASRLTLEPSIQDVILANTILYNTEINMSKALGEYGKSRHSEVSNSILVLLNNSPKPLSVREIYKEVGRDLNKFNDILDIIGSLLQQERIQRITGTKGAKEEVLYLPNNVAISKWQDDLIDMNLLYKNEQSIWTGEIE